MINFDACADYQIASFLLENLDALSERDQSFASSLSEGVAKYGKATDKQRYWLVTLAKRVAQPPKTKEEIGKFDDIMAMFDKAAATLKRPALLIDDGAEGLRLSVAGERSSNPGTINVTTRGSFEDRTWYGRINKDGSFSAGRSGAPDHVVEALRKFAQDPQGQATAYGKRFGVCCFCARELTDQRSIDVGYGPICAERWNLDWG